MWFALIVICFVSMANAYQRYQDLIPNGHNVPNPCSGAQDPTWHAVGHMDPNNHGWHHQSSKNAFGQDFMYHNHNWKEVCWLDSDGDGRTNGAELGDPQCEYTPGITLTRSAVGHPGICDNPDFPDRCGNDNNDQTRFCR